MRIALFTETYTPQVNGVVTHIKVLKEGLEKQGHTVLVVTADTKTLRHYIKEGVLYCPAAEMKKIYGYGLANPISPRRLALIKKFKPDIIHIHHEFGVCLSGAIAAKLLRVPLVYTLHTMYDDYIYYVAARPFRPMVRRVSHLYERMIASMSSQLTGPSRKVSEFLKNCGVSKNVEIIPNSVELDTFLKAELSDTQKQELYQKLKIPSEVTICCFCGRMGKEKSVDVLLECFAFALKTHPNLHLLLIGGGPEEEELHRLAETLGVAEQVSFTGKVPHDQVHKYYALCDLYTTASLSEMYSISMIEAQAAGLFVLQRYDYLNEEQIQTGVNGDFFETKEEFLSLIKDYESKTPEEKKIIRSMTRESVRSSGAENLATYLLTVYGKALLHKKTKKS